MHFFFQYNDETPFVIDSELQAWDLIRTSSNSNWVRKGLKYIGQSKGIIFKSIMAEIQQESSELKINREKLQKEVLNYEKAFNKAKFEDLLEDNDPKLKKFELILEGKEEEIQTVSKELEELTRTVKIRAFDNELEEARKNTVKPKDFTLEMGSLNEKNIPLSTIKSRI